jgi:hypothetical protein
VFLVENFQRLRNRYVKEHFLLGHRYEDPVARALVTDRALRTWLVTCAMKSDVALLPREVKHEYRLMDWAEPNNPDRWVFGVRGGAGALNPGHAPHTRAMFSLAFSPGPINK